MAGLSEQLSLFACKSAAPEGLRVAALPLQPFQFGQCEGKRRVASFGFRYDDSLRRLQEAEPIPPWLGPRIERLRRWPHVMVPGRKQRIVIP
jgi:hypothetical protein